MNSAVKCIDHCWIPMPDGTRLGARLWLPSTTTPCPAILEYIPYRKDDATALRDSNTIAHLANHGYACIRVDMRGAGSSSGVLHDEYSDQEVADGVSVIEWIAMQEWCNGKVGMMGISWGGITSMQIAQKAPSALKTIIALGATDQRYYDDAGYYMGCMTGQTISWAALMFSFNTRPPDPECYGDDWKSLWLNRLQTAPHYLETWLAHQHNDSYWKNNSVDCNHDLIKIPVYAISGHADCWPNTVPRLLHKLKVPVRGLQGAWSHRYPHLGIPGPTVDFLSDAKRWFDHWLRNNDTGILEEANFHVYLQDSVKPKSFYETRPGRWVGLSGWPSKQVETEQFYLGNNALTSAPSQQLQMDICSPQTVGQHSGEYMPWFAYGPGEELPGDQQEEDSGSLVFDTEILDREIQILGNSSVSLNLSSDFPQALVATRLCDVWPDGSSTFITRGILNLSQRNGKSNPKKLEPGKFEQVKIELNYTGYVIPKGHKLRLAISTSYWPIAWPGPTQSTITINTSQSTLYLPVLKLEASDQKLTKFGETKVGECLETVELRPTKLERKIKSGNDSTPAIFEIISDNGKIRFANNQFEMGSTSVSRFSIDALNPLSAVAEYHWEWEYGRGDWQTKTRSYTRLSCDETYFYLSAESTAWENGVEIFNKKWDKKFLRDHF